MRRKPWRPQKDPRELEIRGGSYFDRIQYSIDCKEHAVVEVAGIEPASEGLQRIEPTCVSNPFRFRERNVRIGRSARPLAP